MLLTSSFQYLIYGFVGILMLIFFLIIGVLIYGYIQYKQFIHREQWSKIINKLILDAIVVGKREKKYKISQKGIFQNFEFRNFFLQKLVASERKFSGDAEHEIIHLFEDYKLEREALQKLSQKKEYLIVVGIQELTSMRAQNSISKIEAFLNHPSLYVKQEAQYSMVVFKGFDGLRFLHSTSSVISEWQQLRLLLSLTKIPENTEQDILAWLSSPNDSVVILTLRILRKFQMFSFYHQIFPLLSHPSTSVRKETIQTLHVIENINTTQDFIDIYDENELDVKMEILKIMKLSKDPNSISFLKQQLFEDNSPQLILKAAEALLALNQVEYLQQKSRQYSSELPISIIIKQSLKEKV